MSASVALASSGFGLAGCTTTPPRSGASTSENADKRRSINADVDSTLARLYTTASGSRELVGKARGVLVFPSVIQAGFWIGGQHGEGALRVGGQTTGYYSKHGWRIIRLTDRRAVPRRLFSVYDAGRA